MNYMFRLAFLVFSLSVAAACGAFGYELDAARKSQVEQLAIRVGKEMKQQNKLDSDIEKVVQSLVKNSYAQAVNPQMPEAPLPDSAMAEINSLTLDVLKQIGIKTNPEPVPAPNPSPAPNPTPTPNPTPNPNPDNPPKPGQSNIVWVFVPVNPSVTPAPINYIPVMPQNSQAPTILIHRGWHGNPPTVRFRYR
ncbi:MAG: hypothetical protein ACKO85_12770 [Isosphaeraceae bacterium]